MLIRDKQIHAKPKVYKTLKLAKIDLDSLKIFGVYL